MVVLFQLGSSFCLRHLPNSLWAVACSINLLWALYFEDGILIFLSNPHHPFLVVYFGLLISEGLLGETDSTHSRIQWV